MMKRSSKVALDAVKTEFGDDMYQYLLKGYEENALNDDTDFMAVAHEIAVSSIRDQSLNDPYFREDNI